MSEYKKLKDSIVFFKTQMLNLHFNGLGGPSNPERTFHRLLERLNDTLDKEVITESEFSSLATILCRKY